MILVMGFWKMNNTPAKKALALLYEEFVKERQIAEAKGDHKWGDWFYYEMSRETFDALHEARYATVKASSSYCDVAIFPTDDHYVVGSKTIGKISGPYACMITRNNFLPKGKAILRHAKEKK